MKICSSGLSDVGRKRSHNEDAWLENSSLGLYAVADGLGGHEAGEVASAMALDILSGELVRFRKLLDSYRHGPTVGLRKQISERLGQAVQKAGEGIFEAAKAEDRKRGMGTTLSALLIVGQSGFIAHVGDSRIYLLREGRIHRVTEDHTLLQEQIKRGLLTDEEIEVFPYKNVITRGVGLLQSVAVDLMHMEVAPKDRFLLCSDGLHGHFADEEIMETFNHGSLREITEKLIALANERGGQDNITAVAVEIPELAMVEGNIEVNDKLDALRHISLFKNLSYSDLIKALNIARIENFAKGSIIIREGEQGDSLYILLNGAVDIMKENIYLTSLKPGGHFGEMALVDNDRRSATVRANRDSDMLVIERADFYRLINEEPHLSVKILMNFVNVLSNRLRQTTAAFSDSRRKITEINLSS